MGHNINAFIGKNNIIEKLSDDWIKARTIPLKQGFSMVYLTDELLDDMTELSDLENEWDCPEMMFFTKTVFQIMQRYSKNTILAYIETDYFGGTGTQAGVLFENGKIVIEPTKEEKIINKILHRLGVYKEKDKDEFDSLSLRNYRRMYD